MKKFTFLFFVIYIWSWSIFNAVKADGIDIERATGQCWAKTNIASIDFKEYDKIWINPTLDYKYSEAKDVTGVDQDSFWLEKTWEFHAKWRDAVELCAMGGVYEGACDDIVEHTKYLASHKKMLKNRNTNKDTNEYYEATLFNNFSIGHILTAYGVALQVVEVDAETHKIIGDQFLKAIKSNNRLFLGNGGPKYINNHHLISARALALYGTIWNDDKAVKKARKWLERYYKTMTKEGALKYEAMRGHRALYYTGRTLTAVISILNILEDGGEQAWSQAEKDWVAKAVEFYLDASDDNMKIYKWAKIKKHNKLGDPKVQEMTHPQKGWVRPFVQRFKDSHPELVMRLLADSHVQTYLRKDEKRNGDQWTTVDPKCFYAIGGRY